MTEYVNDAAARRKTDSLLSQMACAVGEAEGPFERAQALSDLIGGVLGAMACEYGIAHAERIATACLRYLRVRRSQ